jgi:hypothetical protein
VITCLIIGQPFSREFRTFAISKIFINHVRIASLGGEISHVLGQPKWISGSEQHFGWIRGWAGGESDRRVGRNRMSKMTPDINPTPDSNPKPRTDRVVLAK